MRPRRMPCRRMRWGPDAAPNPTVIVFFTATSNGNMGGTRAGADAVCATAAADHSELAGMTVHTVACVDDVHELETFPTLLSFPDDAPIISLSRNSVADDWADLMDGPSSSLQNAGVFGGATQFLTACANPGSGCVHTCTGLSSTAGNGCVGKADLTDSTWMAWGNVLSCDSDLAVLCMAVGPDWLP